MAPPIFGRAAITLGICPHSSWSIFLQYSITAPPIRTRPWALQKFVLYSTILLDVFSHNNIFCHDVCSKPRLLAPFSPLTQSEFGISEQDMKHTVDKYLLTKITGGLEAFAAGRWWCYCVARHPTSRDGRRRRDKINLLQTFRNAEVSQSC